MSSESAQTNTTPEAKAPAPTGRAKAFGTLLAKGYLAIYLVLIVSYIINVQQGARTIRVAELRSGDRFWADFHFVHEPYGRIEFAAGDTLQDDLVDLLHKARPGYRAVPPSKARAGMMLWDVYSCEMPPPAPPVSTPDTPEITVPLLGAVKVFTKDEMLTEEQAATIRTAALDGKAGEMQIVDEVAVHKASAFYNLPWVWFFGIWNFTGLVLLLYTLAGDALPAALVAHGEKVSGDLRDTRAAKAHADELRKHRDKLVEDLEREHKTLLARGKEEAVEIHERLLQEAADDIVRMRESHARQLETEAKSALHHFRAEMAAAAVACARQEIGAGVSASAQQKLVEDFTLHVRSQKLD